MFYFVLFRRLLKCRLVSWSTSSSLFGIYADSILSVVFNADFLLVFRKRLRVFYSNFWFLSCVRGSISSVDLLYCIIP